MRNRMAPLGALIGGVGLALVLAATVVGYAGQTAGTVEVSGPSGPQACGTPITISAVVQEVETGALIEGQPVSWSFVSGNVSGDKINTATSTTNASGVAKTTVTFACSPRSGVTIRALADQASGTTVIAVSGEALPRTDTAPTPSSIGMLLAAMAVLLGAGMMLRRLALARR
jgi:hypothetical protein